MIGKPFQNCYLGFLACLKGWQPMEVWQLRSLTELIALRKKKN